MGMFSWKASLTVVQVCYAARSSWHSTTSLWVFYFCRKKLGLGHHQTALSSVVVMGQGLWRWNVHIRTEHKGCKKLLVVLISSWKHCMVDTLAWRKHTLITTNVNCNYTLLAINTVTLWYGHKKTCMSNAYMLMVTMHLEKYLPVASLFFKKCVLPEMFSKWYTREHTVAVPNITDMPPDDEDNGTWCYCKEAHAGEMIACDNKTCPVTWYHISCLKMTSVPKGKWMCPSCHPSRKSKHSK